MIIVSCSKSKADDEGGQDMTPYADADEECRDDGVIPDKLDRFSVWTMMLSGTFNPYTYHQTGEI